jgi:hypothetical protein
MLFVYCDRARRLGRAAAHVDTVDEMRAVDERRVDAAAGKTDLAPRREHHRRIAPVEPDAWQLQGRAAAPDLKELSQADRWRLEIPTKIGR